MSGTHISVLRIVPDEKSGTRGTAFFSGRSWPCAIGGAGIVPACSKAEGDEATPAGLFWPERILYRPDRVDVPQSALLIEPLNENSGWCEDPESPDYNRYVSHPHPHAAEKMWRKDHLYDLVLVISHNRHPVTPGKGSAIFFHLAREGFSPTRGCVAFEKETFLEILEGLDAKTLIRIHPPRG